MQNRHPLTSLMALALLGAMTNPTLAQQPAAQAKSPQPDQAQDFPSLDQMFAALGEGDKMAEPTRIAQSFAIPEDIADHLGMNDAGFDPQSPHGAAIALMAAVKTKLREFAATAPVGDVADIMVADGYMGAAIATLRKIDKQPA